MNLAREPMEGSSRVFYFESRAFAALSGTPPPSQPAVPPPRTQQVELLPDLDGRACRGSGGSCWGGVGGSLGEARAEPGALMVSGGWQVEQ